MASVGNISIIVTGQPDFIEGLLKNSYRSMFIPETEQEGSQKGRKRNRKGWGLIFIRLSK